ncbi:MAG TPA: twin-arginine translocase subunit TatC [Bacteroidia bacterium]|nr:twin-arginine translocase subunit TatC [Bacteroidia bacterium]
MGGGYVRSNLSIFNLSICVGMCAGYSIFARPMGIFGNKKKVAGEMSFLGHLEALRWHLVRSAIAVVVGAGVAFAFPEILFGKILFGPKSPDFATYTFLCGLSKDWGMGDAMCFTEFKFTIFNEKVTGQFALAMWASIVAGIIAAFPYILWELWRFIKPALQQKEVNAARGFIFYATGLFLTGVLFGYFVVSPLALYFLGNFHVDANIPNQWTLDSYISVVTTLVMMMGLVFELPIVIYFLARFGLITAAFMRKYRRHSAIAILILAAIITPTTDVFTQILVAVPLWVLYEASIIVARRVEKKQNKF